MTPESLNSPLLDNGSLTDVSMEMRIRGDRLGTKRAFHVNGLNKGSTDTHMQQTFSMDTGGTISAGVQRRVILSYLGLKGIQKLSVQLWSGNQLTTGADEVTVS
jgi:hypothetical protein